MQLTLCVYQTRPAYTIKYKGKLNNVHQEFLNELGKYMEYHVSEKSHTNCM